MHVGDENGSDEHASNNEKSFVWREIDAAFENSDQSTDSHRGLHRAVAEDADSIMRSS